MKIPHPIIGLAWRLAADKKRLLRELDETRAELSVAKCREQRWKRAAYAAVDGNPQARRLLDFQSTSDALADAPEVDDRDRNTAPRSAP